MDHTAISSAIYVLATLCIKGLVWVINNVYSLILLLADVDLFDIFGNDIKNKFLALVGLFMVFKLSFAVIQYIIDPDKMTNSSSGAQKVLVRVVIALALLGTIDRLFSEAKNIQAIVLKDGVMEKLIFGTNSGNIKTDIGDDDMSEDDNARYISYALFAPFIRFNNAAFIENGKVPVCGPGVFMNSIGKPGTGEYSCEGDCCAKFEDEAEKADKLKPLKDAILRHNIGSALYQVATLKMNKKMIFELDWFLAPVIGIIASVILVVIAINVAIRAVKLALLQLIAPLPIISYIDVNDKNNMFQKWLKLVISTYIDLFIRLFSFFFAIMIITKVITEVEGGIPTFSGEKNYTFADHPIVIIFLIIGSLLFATQLPKILKDLFGYDGDGPTKGFIGKGLSAIGAGVVGLGAGAIGGAVAANNRIRQRVAEINSDSSLTDAQKRKARINANWSTLGKSLLMGEGLSAGANALIGGFKGKGNLSSTLSSINSGVTTAAARRNAKLQTYTGADGKQHSAYNGVLSNIRKKMTDFYGLDDKTSARSRLDQNKKDAETTLRKLENVYNEAIAQRTVESTQISNVRQDISASENLSGDFFDSVIGSGAKYKDGKAIIYTKVGTDGDGNDIIEQSEKNIEDFTFSDYASNLDALRSKKYSELLRAGKSTADANSLADDYKNGFNVSEDGFNKMKNATISYKVKDEQVAHVYEKYTEQQKAVKKIEKSLNTVDKALK